MAFPVRDLRFTTRRSGGETLVYPRLLRDASLLPRVDIAIQHFESMVGHERREMQPEVLVYFLGDYKLARCLVACLGRAYRFRARQLDEVVTRAAQQRLLRARIGSPTALRLWLFDQVNDFGFGFLGSGERDARVGHLEGQLKLRPGELERLMYLDADEHAVLTRVGAQPKAADLVAHYNVTALESLLRHAEDVELQLVGLSADSRRTLHELLRASDVDGDLTGSGSAGTLRLRGRQDALGQWARHGRRLSRLLLELLQRGGRAVTGGSAVLAVRERKLTLRLADELLDGLAGGAATNDLADGTDPWPAAIRAAGVLLRSRRAAQVRTQPDPSAWAAGVALPALLLRGPAGSYLVCGVRSAEHATRLAPLARSARDGEPLLFVGPEGALAALREVGAAVVGVSSPEPDEVATQLAAHLAEPLALAA